MDQHASRRHLMPLPGGPWLDDTSGTRLCRAVVLIGLAVMVISIIGGNAAGRHAGPEAGGWVVVLLAGVVLMGFGAIGYGLGRLARSSTQTCPECLVSMPRGATTCPHCHFRPVERGTR